MLILDGKLGCLGCITKDLQLKYLQILDTNTPSHQKMTLSNTNSFHIISMEVILIHTSWKINYSYVLDIKKILQSYKHLA